MLDLNNRTYFRKVRYCTRARKAVPLQRFLD